MFHIHIFLQESDLSGEVLQLQNHIAELEDEKGNLQLHLIEIEESTGRQFLLLFKKNFLTCPGGLALRVWCRQPVHGKTVLVICIGFCQLVSVIIFHGQHKC